MSPHIPTSPPIKVLLTGGPDAISHERRVRNVSSLADRVKLELWGGHEHFAYRGESQPVGDERLPLFHWVMRTTAAE